MPIDLFESDAWPSLAAGRIQNEVILVLAERGHCNVMLTGGRSAARLYAAWSELPSFHESPGVDFYFGDERCVSPEHSESNYGMAMKTLFQGGMPAGCSVFRMEAEAADREAASRRYEELLPDTVDVLILGVGEDGHIASLFPNSDALQEQERWVIPTTGPKPPFDRLTITPPVIRNARSVFVLAAGEAKASVLHSALKMPADFSILPACLVLNGIWLLDSASPESNV